MKTFGLFMMLLFLWQPGFSKNLVLVEFSTNSYDSTLSWLSDMEAIGVTPRHVFPPNLAIVEAFGLPKEYLGTGSERWTVHSTGDMMGDPMLLKSHPARAAFLHITGAKGSLESPPEGAHFNCPPLPDAAKREVQTSILDRL